MISRSKKDKRVVGLVGYRPSSFFRSLLKIVSERNDVSVYCHGTFSRRITNLQLNMPIILLRKINRTEEKTLFIYFLIYANHATWSIKQRLKRHFSILLKLIPSYKYLRNIPSILIPNPKKILPLQTIRIRIAHRYCLVAY